MPPQWFVTLLTIVLLIALASGFILIGAILLGIIKPVRKKPHTVLVSAQEPAAISATMPPGIGKLPGTKLFKNPGFMWGVRHIDIDGKPQAIPFPILRWWVLFEERNRDFLLELHEQFIKQFGAHIEGGRIYAGSAFATDFLIELKENLQNLRTSVFLLDPFNLPPPPKPNQKTLLFDLSFNTGKTLEATRKRLSKAQIYPDLLLFLIVNDFVPPTTTSTQLEILGGKMKYLYTASALRHHWDWGREEIPEALLVIREALNGDIDWQDDRVSLALENLKEVL